MKNLMKNEGLNLLMVALPFIYLGYLYGGLPAEVPIHWNARGEVDRMGSKAELWLLPILLPLLTFIIMLIIPKLDPKKKMGKMGGKLQSLKLTMVFFMSALAIYIIHVAANPETMRISGIGVLIGLLFMGLGNFSKTIQPNYFLGIRTPWTLESESVWKDTHRMAGVMWMVGGLTMFLAGILFNGAVVLLVIIIVAIIITFVPVVYSWIAFKKTVT